MLDNENNVNIEQLLLNEQNYLKNFVKKFGLNYEEQQDLIQEVNIKILESKDKYNHQQKFRNWLNIITRNIFINNYRLEKRHGENRIDFDPYQLDECKLSSEESDSNLLYQEIFDIIKSDKDYLLITAFYSGYSYCQIAEIFELNEGTLKSRIFQAKKRLKTKILTLNKNANYEGNRTWTYS